MQPTTRRRILRIAGFVLALQLVLPALLWAARGAFLFHPWPCDDPAPNLARLEPALTGIERRIPGADGAVLSALDIAPSRGVPDGGTLLFLHGNGGHALMRLDVAAAFARRFQVRVLLLDYAGYGRSTGSPSEAGVVADAIAAHDWLLQEGVAPDRLFVFGESLGGSVAAALAARRPVAGIAVQSTFSSLESMVWRRFGWLPLLPLLVSDSLTTGDDLTASGLAPLVIHGTHDRVVPHGESDALALVPGATRVSVPGGGHSDVWRRGGDRLFETLRAHVDESLGRTVR